MNNNQLVVGVTSFCAMLVAVVAAVSGLTTLSAESSTSGGIDGSTNGGLSEGSLTNSFLSMLTTTPSSENSTGPTSGNLTSSLLSMLTTTPSSENSTGPYTTTTVSTSPSCTIMRNYLRESALSLVWIFGFFALGILVFYLFIECYERLACVFTGTSNHIPTDAPPPYTETIELISVGGSHHIPTDAPPPYTETIELISTSSDSQNTTDDDEEGSSDEHLD